MFKAKSKSLFQIILFFLTKICQIYKKYSILRGFLKEQLLVIPFYLFAII